MTIYQETPFQKAIEAVESLPFDERQEVLGKEECFQGGGWQVFESNLQT